MAIREWRNFQTDGYSGKSIAAALKAGQSVERTYDLNPTHGWYDLVVTVESDSTFRYQLAGHVETGGGEQDGSGDWDGVDNSGWKAPYSGAEPYMPERAGRDGEGNWVNRSVGEPVKPELSPCVTALWRSLPRVPGSFETELTMMAQE